MTRSISFSRPMTGSSLPARAASVRLIPSWSTVGVLLVRLVSWAGPAERALGQDADHLVADLVEVHAEGLQDARRDAFALADEAKQQVLRADVVVPEAARLVDGELDHALGPRRQADLSDDRPVAPPDDELDRGPHLGQLDVHVLEHARRDTLALAHEAEKQVLGADVVVVEPLGLVLGKRQDLARAVGELVEPVHEVGSLRADHAAGRVMLARQPGVARTGRRPARPPVTPDSRARCRRMRG